MAGSSSAKCNLSSSLDHLTENQKERYVQKASIISVRDPYNVPENLFTPLRECSFKNLPKISFHEIYEYLVLRVSFYTGKELKAFKSLEANNYLTSGWIKDILAWKVPLKPFFLIKAKVR